MTELICYPSANIEPVDLNPDYMTGATASRIRRFNAFFRDVPFGDGGQEWKTLSVEEIVKFFRKVGMDMRDVYQQVYDAEVREHATRNPIVRWWKEVRGWKASSVPQKVMIFLEIAARCSTLSEWMEQNRSRGKFYVDAMYVFIDKPAEVAKQLAMEEIFLTLPQK